MTEKPICPYQADVLTYLQNELPPDRTAAFSAHLVVCPACRQRLADYQQVRSRLETLLPEPPRPELAEQIMRQVAQLPIRRPRYLSYARIAAGILLILTAGFLFLLNYTKPTPVCVRTRTGRAVTVPPPHTAQPEPVSSALDWLARHQESDGHWSTAKWGGDKQYEVALTGFAVMALAGSEKSVPEKYRPHIRQSVKFLVGQQSPDGRFGPRFSGALYNHGIATVSLLEIYTLTKDKSLKAPLKSALNYLCRTQSPSGGWGYLEATGPPNTAVSFWSLQALLLAKSQGFSEVAPALSRGFHWVTAISDETGRPGYRNVADFPYGAATLSAMAGFCYTYGGADYLTQSERYQQLFRRLAQDTTHPSELNYYRTYFVAYLEHPDLSDSRRGLLKAVTQQQSQSADLAGSWEPTGEWSPVGGRVYTTALAALALESSTRGARLKEWLTKTD